MASKTVPNSIFIANEGAYLVPQIVNEMRFLWTPSAQFELGIDGTIEIVEPKTGQGTGNIIKVQIKTTVQPWAEETNESFSYLVRQQDLDYWLAGNTPVILICCKAGTEDAYWVPVKNYFASLDRRHERKVRFSKSQDRFVPECREAIAQLAVPVESGLYISPVPKEEILYSNLLPVTFFPEIIYHASTTCRDNKEAGLLLRELADNPAAEWIVTGKRFYSFHDLSGSPWNEVCDQGDIETLSTPTWAFAEDQITRRNFVRLLNRCLSEKFKNERVWFCKPEQIYYFGINGTLDKPEARTIKEVSISRTGTKTVVMPHMSKSKPGQINYWRHLAIDPRFLLFDDQWFLEISPTYLFTRDGSHISRYGSDYLKGIKKLEKNNAVLRNVLTWARLLQSKTDMFSLPYKNLEFGPLAQSTLNFGISDKDWLANTDDDEANALRTDLDLDEDMLL